MPAPSQVVAWLRDSGGFSPVRWSTDFCAQRLSRKIVTYLEVTAFSKHADCSSLEMR
jgi:hypothetical protein